MSSWCASSLGARVEASSLIYGERCSLGTLQGAKSLQLVAVLESGTNAYPNGRVLVQNNSSAHGSLSAAFRI